MFYRLIRPFLFMIPPEKAHEYVLTCLAYMPRFCFSSVEALPLSVMGMVFKHPVGLAAGLDKNGDYIDALGRLGFSFLELGTVTPKPQLGNPLPRLFRIPEKQALINRMGFNNLGIDYLVSNIKKASYEGKIGVNIGKNKETSLNKAHEDYLYCLRKAYEVADYITVNISSPNTPDLRQLQQVDYFQSLVSMLREEQLQLADTYQKYVPLVIKISPDETDESLKRMAFVMLNEGIDGVIATNTTADKRLLEGLPYSEEGGGISGKVLGLRALHCLRLLKEEIGTEMAIIGVGGIDSAERAKLRISAGADLIQLYTGLIYKGPGLLKSTLSGCSDAFESVKRGLWEE